jgi:hypothetical protein
VHGARPSGSDEYQQMTPVTSLSPAQWALLIHRGESLLGRATRLKKRLENATGLRSP